MNGEGFSDGMDPRCSFNFLFIGVMHPPPANLCVMQKLPILLHDELASPNSGHLRARHVERGVDHRRRLKLAAGWAKRCRGECRRSAGKLAVLVSWASKRARWLCGGAKILLIRRYPFLKINYVMASPHKIYYIILLYYYISMLLYYCVIILS